MIGKFLFLGTGASTGVPLLGCSCPVCSSSSHFNKRLRPSGLVTLGDKVLLIDVGPDFRTQALTHNIRHIDGVMITHTHYDHIAGLDDLRPFNFLQGRKMPCLLSKESFDDLKIRYYYIMAAVAGGSVSCTQLQFHTLKKDCGEVHFLEIPLSFCSYFQNGMKVTGFRIGNFAYITDICQFEEKIFEIFSGVEVLVLSSLKETSSPAHLSLDQGVGFAKKLGVKECYFTHIGHEMDHEAANRTLPSNMRLAYDGLEISFTLPDIST